MASDAIEYQRFLAELFPAVLKMRKAQKTYFAVRMKQELIESKQAEHEVDELLRQLDLVRP